MRLLVTLSFLVTLALAQRPIWFEHAVIYEIFPRSFQDSNNDGIGDLKGKKKLMKNFIRLFCCTRLNLDNFAIKPMINHFNFLIF